MMSSMWLGNLKMAWWDFCCAYQADSLLEHTNMDFGFSLVKTKDGFGPSDQSSFVHTGTPVLYFTSDCKIRPVLRSAPQA